MGYRDTVIHFKFNIIEIRKDINRSFGREILKAAPDEVVRELFLLTQTQRIVIRDKTIG